MKVFFLSKPSNHEYKTSFGIIRPKQHVYFRCFFVCSFSPSLINYACSNFRSTCTMALMSTLQHELELSTLPSIPSNSHFGGLFYFLFYYHSQKRLSCYFSSRISSNSRTTACKICLRHISFTQTTDCEHA